MRTIGNRAQTSAGGGGHNAGRLASGPNRTLQLLPRAEMGTVDGQGKRSGTSGDVVHMTTGVRETMSENGIMGR